MKMLVAALLLGLVGPATAADQFLTGDMIQLARELLGVRSRDAAVNLGGGVGSADDPTLHGGTVRAVSVEGDVFDEQYTLPASGWRYLKRRGQVVGYRFSGPAPIRTVRVKTGKGLRVFGKGAGLGHTLGANPVPVRVVLTLGQQQYCMAFGGSTQFNPGNRYIARHADAPDRCPLPYPNDSSWLCRPGMANNQCFVNSIDATKINPDNSTTAEPHTGANEDQPYDCFYVYPTVDLAGPVGNHMDVTDPTYVSLTLDPLLQQAARFNDRCRIFAPHYRQITFLSFNSPQSAALQDFAYQDVRDAWRIYRKYYNGGRNVVIMGHSQGTFMTTRLMQEEVDNDPSIRSQLIAALLIGGNVTVPQGGVVGGSFQNVPLCQSDGETGCVIAYRSYADGFEPTNGSNDTGNPALDRACVKPGLQGVGSAAGAFTGTYFPTHTNQPLFQVAPDPMLGTAFVKYENFYAGRCWKDATNHSFLEIFVQPGPGDMRTNPIPFTAGVLSPALLGTHILDYSWPLEDLLAVVATKAAAMP